VVERNVKVDAGKCKKMVWNAMDRDEEDVRAVIQLVSLAKSRTALQGMMEKCFWKDISRHHDVPLAEPERAFAVAQRVLEKSNEMLDVIDFDDMLYLPVLHNCRLNLKIGFLWTRRRILMIYSWKSSTVLGGRQSESVPSATLTRRFTVSAVRIVIRCNA